jgi:hypothetical protein
MLLLVAIVAAIAGTWLSRREAMRVTITSPADTLDARAAFLMGGRFGTAGRHAESIPYFRRAVAAGMGEQWEGRFNLAASLINAALEVETRLGKADPALRTSYERVQSVFDGMAEARHAMRLARETRMGAYTVYQDAVMLQFWGMPWDALATAKKAASIDPGWDLPRRLVLDLQRDLAHGGMTP